MRFLVVYCHPDPESFASAVRQLVVDGLKANGHEIKLIDLYAEEFQPALTYDEKQTYVAKPKVNARPLQEHVDALAWCEGMAFVFPTWFHGPPAMLKGWFERAWLPGYAFDIPRRQGETVTSKLRHVRRLLVVTTSGSPWWWIQLIGNPCRRLFTRAIRALFALSCKTSWLQLYSMNNTTAKQRQQFLDRVSRTVAAIRG
ncbi:MAG: NAD(P)H-dependent oxidoreductase [Planctomycetota bacterium]